MGAHPGGHKKERGKRVWAVTLNWVWEERNGWRYQVLVRCFLEEVMLTGVQCQSTLVSSHQWGGEMMQEESEWSGRSELHSMVVVVGWGGGEWWNCYKACNRMSVPSVIQSWQSWPREDMNPVTGALSEIWQIHFSASRTLTEHKKHLVYGPDTRLMWLQTTPPYVQRLHFFCLCWWQWG